MQVVPILPPQRGIDLIEEPVIRALEEVRKVYPDVFLAGGYLRDRKTGVRPRDVDFFTCLPICDGRIPMTHSDPGSASLGESRITSVEQDDILMLSVGEEPKELGDLMPMQIIHIDNAWAANPWSVVQKFLFGATQVFWTPEKYGYTDEYLQDLLRKRFTVLRCAHEYDIQAVINKWCGTPKVQGLKYRFPGWDLVIPKRWWDHFEQVFTGVEVENNMMVVQVDDYE